MRSRGKKQAERGRRGALAAATRKEPSASARAMRRLASLPLAERRRLPRVAPEPGSGGVRAVMSKPRGASHERISSDAAMRAAGPPASKLGGRIGGARMHAAATGGDLDAAEMTARKEVADVEARSAKRHRSSGRE